MANGKKQRVSKTTLYAFLRRKNACEPRREFYKDLSFFMAYKKLIDGLNHNRHRPRMDALWFLGRTDLHRNFFSYSNSIQDSNYTIKERLKKRYLKLRSRIR